MSKEKAIKLIRLAKEKLSFDLITDVGKAWREVTDFPIGMIKHFKFRIKPEVKKYRPFANVEECWTEMKKHQPFGWIKSKEDGSRSLITLIISEENIDINCIGGFNSDKIMKRFTFDDGAVFGILEEE